MWPHTVSPLLFIGLPKNLVRQGLDIVIVISFSVFGLFIPFIFCSQLA